MRFRVFNLQLDGTNDVPVDLPERMISITVLPQTSTVTVELRPSSNSDFLSLLSGRSITLEQPGQLIEPTRVTLSAASAVAVDLIVGYP